MGETFDLFAPPEDPWDDTSFTLAAKGSTRLEPSRRGEGLNPVALKNQLDAVQDANTMIVQLAGILKGLVANIPALPEHPDAKRLPGQIQTAATKFFTSAKALLSLSDTADQKKRLEAFPGIAALFLKDLIEANRKRGALFGMSGPAKIWERHDPGDIDIWLQKVAPAVERLADYADALSREIPLVSMRRTDKIGIAKETLGDMARPLMGAAAVVTGEAYHSHLVPALLNFLGQALGLGVEMAASGRDIALYGVGTALAVLGAKTANLRRNTHSWGEAIGIVLPNFIWQRDEVIAPRGVPRSITDLPAPPQTATGELPGLPIAAAVGDDRGTADTVAATMRPGFEHFGQVIGAGEATWFAVIIYAVMRIADFFGALSQATPFFTPLFLFGILVLIFLGFTWRNYMVANDPGRRGDARILRAMTREAGAPDTGRFVGTSSRFEDVSDTDGQSSWKHSKDGNALWNAWLDLFGSHLGKTSKKNKSSAKKTKTSKRPKKKSTKVKPASKRSRSLRKTSKKQGRRESKRLSRRRKVKGRRHMRVKSRTKSAPRRK